MARAIGVRMTHARKSVKIIGQNSGEGRQEASS